MKVIKNSGHIVPFDIEKLKLSLQKSGAVPDFIKKSLLQIQNKIYEYITPRKYTSWHYYLKKSIKRKYHTL